MRPNIYPARLSMPVQPYRLSGIVYGTLLNHDTALAALGYAMTQVPYKAAPKAPVLFCKPRNTIAATGEAILVADDIDEIEAAGCLGIVIGRTACHVAEANALDHVAGYLVANDISVPHSSFYRPAIRFKARDGFCPLGAFAPRAAVADPNSLTIRTLVDGELMQSANTAQLLRPVERLLADVTEFMTLSPGDVLMVGAAAPAPRVRAGQIVTVEIAALGAITNPIAREAA